MRRAVFTWAAVIVAMLAVESRGDLPDWAVDKPDLPVNGAASKLQKKISVKYHETRIEDAIAEIAKATGANIVVNWRSLDGAGIEKGTMVNDIALNDVPAMKVIEVVLEYIGGDLVPLAVDTCTDDDIATISTMESLGRFTKIVSYDIRPLIPRGYDQLAPDFDRAPRVGLFESDGESEQLTRGELIGAIMDKVRDTVDPDNWRSAGGLVSSMSEIDGILYINTTCGNHLKIAKLLRMIYENRPKQVSVQATAVSMTAAAAQRVIDKSAGGRLIVDAKVATALAQELADPNDERKTIGGGRFVVFNEQRGYISDRAIRTRMPAPPDTVVNYKVDVHTTTAANEPDAKPKADDADKPDEAEKPKKRGGDPTDANRIYINVGAPQVPSQSLERASLPLAGLVVAVEPSIGLGGDEITLDVLVDQASRAADGAVDEATGVPDYVERRLRSTVTIPNGGAAILSMPDVERGGEIVVFVRAQVVE